MKEVTEYEIEKAKHKRLLVRNEFRGVGKYNIPVVRKRSIDLNKIRFEDFTKSKPSDDENAEKTLHFFMLMFLKLVEAAELQKQKERLPIGSLIFALLKGKSFF